MDRSGQPFRFSIGMPLDSPDLLLQLCRRLKYCMMLLLVFTPLGTMDQSNLQANIITYPFSELSPGNWLQQSCGIRTAPTSPIQDFQSPRRTITTLWYINHTTLVCTRREEV